MPYVAKNPSVRENVCIHPNECKAKMPGRGCRSCVLIAANKTTEHRERAKRRGEQPGVVAAMLAKSHSPEANAKREDARMRTRYPWLPKKYRSLWKNLRRAGIFIDTRLIMLIDQQDIDASREKTARENLPKRIAASHERMKRGGHIGKAQGSFSPLANLD